MVFIGFYRKVNHDKLADWESALRLIIARGARENGGECHGNGVTGF